MKTYQPVADGVRPGFSHTRPVYIVDDLAMLRGSQTGTIILPIQLDRTPSSTYDISNPSRRNSMYAVVLREAGSETDLAEWLDRELLIRHWSEFRLPNFLRHAWEAEHPVLQEPFSCL